MFVAIRFSQRRFKHQMDPLMLLWKQTLNPLPSHRSSVCNANIASSTHTEPFSSILKWPSLDYLSTNCTLTWGLLTVDCWFFSEWNQWDFSWGSREKRRTHHFESKVKAMYGTVPCCDVCSVLLLKFFVKHAHWPLTYIFPQRPRKGYRV